MFRFLLLVQKFFYSLQIYQIQLCASSRILQYAFKLKRRKLLPSIQNKCQEIEFSQTLTKYRIKTRGILFMHHQLIRVMMMRSKINEISIEHNLGRRVKEGAMASKPEQDTLKPSLVMIKQQIIMGIVFGYTKLTAYF